LGEPLTMVFQLATFQGVRYALFSYNTADVRGGAADFDNFTVDQPAPRGLMRPIPYGERVSFTAADRKYGLSTSKTGPVTAAPIAFEVIDMKLGRVALKSEGGLLGIVGDGRAALTDGTPGEAETFQWIETPTGELVLMSLRTNRFLRIDPQTRQVVADAPTPLPDNSDGARFVWSFAK
jgi:xylan 1,4-beta-xylosidase